MLPTVRHQADRAAPRGEHRPVDANGFGLSDHDAAANVRQFLDDMAVLHEDATTTNTLVDLVTRGLALGKQVHDANIVAVALAGGATAIVTDNVRHFARFAELSTIENLTSE